MPETIVKDLSINNVPQLTDFAVMDLENGTITQKTTWQKIKELIVPAEVTPLTAEISEDNPT